MHVISCCCTDDPLDDPEFNKMLPITMAANSARRSNGSSDSEDQNLISPGIPSEWDSVNCRRYPGKLILRYCREALNNGTYVAISRYKIYNVNFYFCIKA